MVIFSGNFQVIIKSILHYYGYKRSWHAPLHLSLQSTNLPILILVTWQVKGKTPLMHNAKSFYKMDQVELWIMRGFFHSKNMFTTHLHRNTCFNVQYQYLMTVKSLRDFPKYLQFYVIHRNMNNFENWPKTKLFTLSRMLNFMWVKPLKAYRFKGYRENYTLHSKSNAAKLFPCFEISKCDISISLKYNYL